MGTDPRLIRVVEASDQQDLPAGRFSAWLDETRNALARGTGTDVPCGDCNACCRSSYFIHVRPEDAQALVRIPEALLFPAPGLPEGHRVMGFDENGHCPMLVDDACSIYEHRPTTCRTYDCRVFPAAGIAAEEDSKVAITQRTRRWRFDYPSEHDRTQHAATQAAARFMRERAELFEGELPTNSTQLAVLAIKVYDVFLKIHEEHGSSGQLPADVEVVDAVRRALQDFDSAVPTRDSGS